MTARLEEAARIATEYLGSLENLPQEAQHVLEEIKHLDARSEELTDMIATETKHYFNNPRPIGRAGIPAAVSRMYDDVNALAADKVALSGRLTKLLERAMARLQHDLVRVVELEGDEPGLPPTQDFFAGVENTVQQINGLRAAAAQKIGSPVPPATRSSSTSAPRAHKKRKANASAGKGKAVSSVPVASGRSTTSRKSGLSLVVQPREKHARSQSTAVPAKRRHGNSGEDAEKENEKGSSNSDGEDDGPYCYCGEGAWGQMIACENGDCAKEWFHLPCAGLEPPLPDVWYCDDCRQDLHAPRTNAPAVSDSAGRRGPKK
ncbi:hypothetical protein V8D89_010192 [Ganoderma adspersum]